LPPELVVSSVATGNIGGPDAAMVVDVAKLEAPEDKREAPEDKREAPEDTFGVLGIDVVETGRARVVADDTGDTWLVRVAEAATSTIATKGTSASAARNHNRRVRGLVFPPGAGGPAAAPGRTGDGPVPGCPSGDGFMGTVTGT
jgi:hypothetical protein